MSNVKIELNLQGINEMMKSSEMQAHLQAAGEAVANAAGDGYAAVTNVEKLRWVAITNVYPDTAAAAHDNFKNNSLLKAVGAVGLAMEKKRK